MTDITTIPATINDISYSSFTIGNLRNGTEYVVELTAKNLLATRVPPYVGPSSHLGFGKTLGVPVVSDVDVVPGNGSLTVSVYITPDFDVPPVTGYSCDISGGEYTRTVDIDTSGSPFTIRDLSNGVAYVVDVRARNKVGLGEPVRGPETTPIPIPGTPTDVSANGGDRTLTVSFTPPDPVEGAEIEEYIYELSLTQDFAETIDINDEDYTYIGLGTTEFTIINLPPGTQYWVRIMAVTSDGVVGDPSVVGVNATGTTFFAPGTPTDVSANGGERMLSVSFTAPALVEGAEIVEYLYELSLTQNFDTIIDDDYTNTGTDTSFTIENLTPGTQYWVRVTAISYRRIFGNPSVVGVNATGTPFAVPGTPTDVSANGGDRMLSVFFTAPEAVTEAPIIGYRYQLSRSDKFTTIYREEATNIGANALNTSFTINGLDYDTQYWVRVIAITNDEVKGDPSVNVATGRTLRDLTPPGAPIIRSIKTKPRSTTNSPITTTIEFVQGLTSGAPIDRFYANTKRVGTGYNDLLERYVTSSPFDISEGLAGIYELKLFAKNIYTIPSTNTIVGFVAENKSIVPPLIDASEATMPPEFTLPHKMYNFSPTNNNIRVDLKYEDPNIWNFGTGDFTIEWYQRQTAQTATIFNVGIVDYPYVSIGCSITHADEVQGSNGLLTTTINGVSTEVNIGAAKDTWIHIAIVRHNGMLTIYGNGVANPSVANIADISNTLHPLYIGTYNRLTPYTQQFTGYLSSFRIAKSAIYTAAFTPHTGTLPTATNATLVLPALP
jgi:hypothetical protein